MKKKSRRERRLAFKEAYNNELKKRQVIDVLTEETTTQEKR